MKPQEHTVPLRVSFEAVDPEGTAALRVCAGHAARVGENWVELAASMFELADSLDDLMAPKSDGGES